MLAAEAYLDVDLTPLLKREFRIRSLSLADPTFRLAIDAEGYPVRPDVHLNDEIMSLFDMDAINLSDVEVTGGTLIIDDARASGEVRIEDIELAGAARSLRGPFDASGSFRIDGLGQTFSVALGRVATDGGLAFKTSSRFAEEPIVATLSGNIDLWPEPPSLTADLEVGRAPLELEGEDRSDPVAAKSDALVASGDVLPLPWSVLGKVAVDATAIALTDIRVDLGRSNAPLVLAGSVALPVRHSEPVRAALTLSQIDAATLESLPALREAATLANLTGLLAALPHPQRDIHVQLGIDTLVMPDALIRNVQLVAGTASEGWDVERFSVDLPGGTRFETGGILSRAPEPSFAGVVSVRSAQPHTFTRWWTKRPATEVPVLAPITLEASVDAGPDEVAATLSELRSGRSALTGEIRWRAGSIDDAPRIDAHLSAERVDDDDLAGLLTMAGAFADPFAILEQSEVDVALDLSVAAFRAEEMTGADLALTASYRDRALTIDKLSVGDFAGAALELTASASDPFGRPKGRVEGSLTAARMAAVVTLAARALGTDRAAFRALEQARSLTPAAITFAVATLGSPDRLMLSAGGTAGRATVALESEIGGLRGPGETREINAAVLFETPEGGSLLNELGLAAVPLGSEDLSRLVMLLSGTPSAGFDVDLEANALGTALDVAGTLRREDGETLPDLEVAFKAPDISVALRTAGYQPPPRVGTIPVDLVGRLGGSTGELAVSGIRGTVAGVAVSGETVLARGTPRPRLSGGLRLAETSLVFLSELALGADAWQTADGADAAEWPAQTFSGAGFDLVDLDLSIVADRLWAGSRDIRGARFDLETTPRSLEIAGLEGRFAGGTIGGSAKIDVLDGAQFTGALSVAGANLADLAWQSGGRAVATGTLDLEARVQSTGFSIASMIAGLAGTGELELQDTALRFVNPNAFELVIRGADAGLEVEEGEIVDAFEDYLDSGPVTVGDVSASFLVAAGTVRLKDVAAGFANAMLIASAAFDLEDWTLNSDWTLTLDPDRDGTEGADAEVGISFSGPLDAPVRRVDVTPFTAFLSMRELERQVEELERLKREILAQEEREAELLETLQRNQAAARRAVAERTAQETAERAEEAAAAAAAAAPAAPAPSDAADTATDAEAEAEARRFAEEAAERERLAREADERRLAAEAAERERLAREAEERRLAGEAAERERLAREAEARRLAEEAAERERLARDAEASRLADETAERQSLAREVDEAERRPAASGFSRERLERQLREQAAQRRREQLRSEQARDIQAELARVRREAEERRRRILEAEGAAERARLARETEEQRLLEEAAERQRLARQAEETRRTEEAAERERRAREDEETRRAEAAERDRLAREADEKRRAEETAERERLAREAEEAAERDRLAREAEEAAERDRLAREADEKRRVEEAAERERLAIEAEETAEREPLAREAEEERAAERERLAREAEEERAAEQRRRQVTEQLRDLRAIGERLGEPRTGAAGPIDLDFDRQRLRRQFPLTGNSDGGSTSAAEPDAAGPGVPFTRATEPGVPLTGGADRESPDADSEGTATEASADALPLGAEVAASDGPPPGGSRRPGAAEPLPDPDAAEPDAADAHAAAPDADPAEAAAAGEAAETRSGVLAGRAPAAAEPDDIGALLRILRERGPVLEPLAPPISVGPPPGAAR